MEAIVVDCWSGLCSGVGKRTRQFLHVVSLDLPAERPGKRVYDHLYSVSREVDWSSPFPYHILKSTHAL
jgi:hypothetical protein